MVSHPRSVVESSASRWGHACRFLCPIIRFLSISSCVPPWHPHFSIIAFRPVISIGRYQHLCSLSVFPFLSLPRHQILYFIMTVYGATLSYSWKHGPPRPQIPSVPQSTCIYGRILHRRVERTPYVHYNCVHNRHSRLF